MSAAEGATQLLARRAGWFDPARGRVITVAYYALIASGKVSLAASGDPVVELR